MTETAYADHESLAGIVKSHYRLLGGDEGVFAKELVLTTGLRDKLVTTLNTELGCSVRSGDAGTTVGNLLDVYGQALGLGPYPRHPADTTPVYAAEAPSETFVDPSIPVSSGRTGTDSGGGGSPTAPAVPPPSPATGGETSGPGSGAWTEPVAQPDPAHEG